MTDTSIFRTFYKPKINSYCRTAPCTLVWPLMGAPRWGGWGLRRLVPTANIHGRAGSAALGRPHPGCPRLAPYGGTPMGGQGPPKTGPHRRGGMFFLSPSSLLLSLSSPHVVCATVVTPHVHRCSTKKGRNTKGRDRETNKCKDVPTDVHALCTQSCAYVVPVCTTESISLLQSEILYYGNKQ